jgi:octaprenyl-diphosphate synthase
VPLPFASAVETLRNAAHARRADDRLEQRLLEVHTLLRDDLAWIEQELARAVETGPAPGTTAAQHLVSRGGKRIRPVALLLSAACFGPIPACARQLAVVAELVHSATLLHDDVVDEGLERRGAPSARRLFGNGVSVLAGDLLLVSALERTSHNAPEVLQALIETLRCLVEGEIVQLRGRTELDVTESTYERILRNKTASLFAWATRSGAKVAGASAADQDRLASFGEELGVAFQLVDDVLDYSGKSTGKNLLADLSEGKLTLPLVLAVMRMPELVEPLRRIHAGDREPVELVSQKVIESGACDEVRRRAAHHTRRAVEAISELAPGPARLLLDRVAYQLAERAA